MNIIKEIVWERTKLILKFDELESKIYLTSKTNEIELENIDNTIKVLLTNTPAGTMLPEGRWKIESKDKEIIVDESIISKLEDLSRVYRYNGDKYAYTITFSIDENMQLYLNTQFMMKNNKPKKIRPLFEAKSIKGKIKKIIKLININISTVLCCIIHKLNKKETILFLSENDNKLRGNALVFYNYLNSKKYKIKIYYKNIYEKKLNYLDKIKEIITIASCKYIIIDNYTSVLNFLNLPKETKIIQLWHAGVGFKSVGYARFGLKGSPHPFLSSHRKYDYVIVDNEDLIEVYEEVFGINKEKIIPAGLLRLENYYDSEKIRGVTNKLYKENKELKNKKIILYAPTFRGRGHKDAYYDMDKIDLKQLANFCNENNFVVLFKFHPYTKNKLEINPEYKNIFFDYTSYDINELMYISDILITDYSSCAYEFSLFERPIIFYRYNKKFYEYVYSVHSQGVCMKESYETENFQEVIEQLKKWSNNPKCEVRNINKKRINTCKTIEDIIFNKK